MQNIAFPCAVTFALMAAAWSLLPRSGSAQDRSDPKTAAKVIVEAEKSEAVAVSPSDVTPGDESLQIVGVLSASHMYTTFGYIGVTADALAKKVYPPERVRELMTEVSAMCDNIVAQMGKINLKKVSPEDARAIEEMISIYRQLKVEAEALKTYAGQRTDKNAADFDAARKTVWPRIEKLLGLNAEGK